jgi:hypothetical protein
MIAEPEPAERNALVGAEALSPHLGSVDGNGLS